MNPIKEIFSRNRVKAETETPSNGDELCAAISECFEYANGKKYVHREITNESGKHVTLDCLDNNGTYEVSLTELERLFAFDKITLILNRTCKETIKIGWANKGDITGTIEDSDPLLKQVTLLVKKATEQELRETLEKKSKEREKEEKINADLREKLSKIVS